ncbi:serine/threonine protein kinase, partial [Myxococcota bacterium]|nr:serine/threonine protein kinase [Myxococcota bacterium]
MEPVGGQGTPSRQYELLGLLGEGGFGAVYLARFLGEGGFEKLVAVKVLNADLEDMVEIARRLRDEARILGLLRHRSIVGVDRLTKLDGRWAVVMEYVVGEDLAQLVRRDRVPTGPALEIIADVASALHAAWHMIGPNGQPLHLLHRDLKPANIRITPDGDVKVLDFGVARAEFDTREAATRSIAFGTPSYMPPERLDLMPDGPEGDIYALGVVLFELVTQERLPQTSANPKRHDRVLSEAQERLRALNIPPQVLQLVLDCMAYEPEARPNARDLEARAVRLSRVLGEDPLRTWAQRGVAREGHGYAPIGGSLSGVVLTEEPPSLLTAWERPAARPQLARTPTPSLVPARTGVCERTP